MKHNYRRLQASISPYSVNQIHKRNPWVPAWWSAAFPGFGHIMLCRYLKGVLLFFWEILINVHAHINEAILYSFTGQFQLAKQVLEVRWFPLYASVYIYAIWDSYRTTAEMNTQYILARQENAPVQKFVINSLEVNYLCKISPKLAVFWSFLMPGTGHLYSNRLPTGIFVLLCWIAIVYQSHLMPAIYHSMWGDFAQARTLLLANAGWYLFTPSFYCFSIYDAYVTTVEYNKLYEMELAQYLQRNYQSENFEMPW